MLIQIILRGTPDAVACRVIVFLCFSAAMAYNFDIPGWMPEPELRILERLALLFRMRNVERITWYGFKDPFVGANQD